MSETSQEILARIMKTDLPYTALVEQAKEWRKTRSSLDVYREFNIWYAALEKEEDLTDAQHEAILSVMDRLSGWCSAERKL